MSERLRAPWFGGILLETLLWLGPAGFFLAAYLRWYAAPAAAVPGHLRYLGLAALALAGVRIVLWSLAPQSRLPRWLLTTLMTLVFLGLSVYYAIVLLGLHSWGRVVTWQLVGTYVRRWPDFAAALSIPPWLAGLILVAVPLVAVLLALRLPERLGWTRTVAARMARPIGVVVGSTLVAIAWVAGYLFSIDLPGRDGEPFSLTFLSLDSTVRTQTHHNEGAPAIDQAELAERAAFTVQPGAKRHNVILLVSDALRADHMGVYGYRRPTTPYLSGLHANGRLDRVDQYYAVCAESFCGLLGMARSKYVFQQSSRAFTLHEVLRRYGYRVGMILAGDHTNFYGLREAYGDLDFYYDGFMATGFYANDDKLVLDYLQRLPAWDGQPTLLQFHLTSNHPLGRREPESLRWQPASNYAMASFLGKPTADPDLDPAINYYDDGVLQCDDVIRRILERLEALGYLSDAVVVVTADHGEMLGEHGLYMHANDIYQGTVRIPLLIERRGYAGEAPIATGRIASQVDLAPTLLHELGIPPPATWVGTALQRPVQRDFLFLQQRAHIGLIDLRDPARPLKYWRDVREGDPHLYDLVADPAEANNLIEQATPGQLADWNLALLPSNNVVAD